MRNLLGAVRHRDRDRVKAEAQKIYLAAGLAESRQAFRHFQHRWQDTYPRLVRRLEQDLPELLNFYSFPRHLGKKLRTTQRH